MKMTSMIKPLSSLSLLVLLAACGSGLTDNQQTKIGCLSAKTAVSISDTIKAGLIAGLQPDELASVEGDKIALGLKALESTVSGAPAADYFKSNVALRLKAIQQVVLDPEADSKSYALYQETYQLAATCQTD